MIEEQGSFSTEELLAIICVGSKSERISANKQLAEFYIKIGQYDQAKVFATRAWILSNFSKDLLQVFIKAHEAVRDFASIKEAYKRIGIEEACTGNVQSAITYFNLWQYTFPYYEKTDKYTYDYDILGAINRLSRPFKVAINRNRKHQSNSKIRIVHILYLHAPALLKIDYAVAEFIDKNRFDVTYVIPQKISPNSNHEEIIRRLSQFNCDVITAEKNDSLEQALTIASRISDCNPDILLNSAPIADFWIYFITLLLAEPIKIVCLMGPPPLYVSNLHDVAITAGNHLLIDCPVDCELFDLELPLGSLDRSKLLDRRNFNIPSDAVVIVSGGRASKFQDQSYWKAIGSILYEAANTYLIVVGVNKVDINFIDSIFSEVMQSRVVFLPFSENYIHVYEMADIAIDTFPQSGGIMIIETMALGIPIVTFENDYFKIYDQVDMSLAAEYCGISELIVSRNNFSEFRDVVLKLVRDMDYRKRLAILCREKVFRDHGDPKRMVKRFEAIYQNSIQRYKENEKKDKKQNETDLLENLPLRALFFYLAKGLRLRFSSIISTKMNWRGISVLGKKV